MAYDKIVDSEALDSTFTDIANAIRSKNGSEVSYSPSEMAEAISAIYSNEDVSGLIDGTITSLTISEGIVSIRAYAFSGCTNLVIESLPDGVASIGASAFNGCKGLETMELPASITTIKYGAFAFCSKLETVTFRGTPTSIDSYAFTNCTNLTSIYIPWSEGEVDNAPWGATNATIYYNSTT